MRVKNWLRRAAAGALCLILCVSALPQAALAIEAPGTITSAQFNADTRNGSLTIQYRDYDDVTFKVYRVAGVDADLNFIWNRTDDLLNRFQKRTDIPTDARSKTTDWRSLAKVLAGEAERFSDNSGKELAGTLEMKSAERIWDPVTREYYREMRLTGLYPGLYLVIGSSHEELVPGEVPGTLETEYVTPWPNLIMVPTWLSDRNGGGNWLLDVTANLRDKVNDPRNRKNLRVIKTWVNNGHAQPESVTVVLYRGDEHGSEQYGDPVVLNSANGWKFDWLGLDAKYNWDVVEINVPNGYTASTPRWVDGSNVAITNTYTPPGRPGGSSPPPTEVIIDEPDVPLSRPSLTPEEIELDDSDVPLGNLPQTGQLWWPVPLLAFLGMAFMMIGLVRRRRGEYDEE